MYVKLSRNLNVHSLRLKPLNKVLQAYEEPFQRSCFKIHFLTLLTAAAPRPATSLARDAPPHSGTRCHNGDPAVRECPSPHLNDQYLKVP